MDDDKFGISVFIGALLATIVMIIIWHSTKIKASIDECEKDLPRSQVCVLRAIPESEIKE